METKQNSGTWNPSYKDNTVLAVLRCRPSKTRLACSWLNEHGVRCFSPFKTVSKRLPRSKRRINVKLDLFPGWLFSDKADWDEFDVRALDAVETYHVSRFRFLGSEVSLAERSVRHLMEVDETREPRAGGYAMICDGIFSGRIGRVLSVSRGGVARMDVEGSVFTLPSFNLVRVEGR